MFPDIDLDTIKDIWLQCSKDKAALTEMLLQLANPEMANDQDIANAAALANEARDSRAAQRLARQDQREEEQQAAML